MQKLPVLITFFNRPALLERLFTSISKRDDIQLFFACDGPRNKIDESKIEACWILVEKYFGKVPPSRKLERSANLGCRNAMKQNLDWFFNLNAFGLILEDDCIPNDDFFKYLGKVLVDFESSKNIMCVAGTDFVPAKFNSSHDLFRTSIFPMVWGWGAWAKKWGFYELEIHDYKDVVSLAADQLFGLKGSIVKTFFKNSFNMRFQEVNNGVIDTWDYSLLASTWRNNFKSLQLNANLVVNSGFTTEATHTTHTQPNWVPTQYRLPKSESNVLSNYDPALDVWLAANVYNCTFVDLLKNQVKKVIRK